MTTKYYESVLATAMSVRIRIGVSDVNPDQNEKLSGG
jgi:hypothetical protein